MTWVRLDENFARHPKIVQAGPLALAMHVAALCYCNQYLTDGFVPKAAVKTFLDLDGIATEFEFGDSEIGEGDRGNLADPFRVVSQLVGAGLWDVSPGGWMIHDYLEYQPSKAKVEADKAQKQAAGRAGGKAAARAKAKQSPSERSTKGQAESKPVSDTESVTDSLKGTSPLPPKGGLRANGESPRQREARLAYIRCLEAIDECEECDPPSFKCLRHARRLGEAEAELRALKVPSEVWEVSA